jgi:hypothetical protein
MMAENAFAPVTPGEILKGLQPSLLEEARKLAELEGVALNQLINVAVAEKLSALRTDDYFSQTCCTCESPQGAKNPAACRRRQAADDR